MQARARTHTCPQQSYPACRRSLLHEHTMKSPNFAVHLHDITAEVRETRRLSGGTLALCGTRVFFFVFFLLLFFLRTTALYVLQERCSFFLKPCDLPRAVNGANLSVQAKRRPIQGPKISPHVTQQNQSAQILTISYAWLLWISAIIAPRVDTRRRARIDVFVRGAAVVAAAAAGFRTLTGMCFCLLPTNLRLNNVAPTCSDVLFRTLAGSISQSVTVALPPLSCPDQCSHL